MAIDGIGTRVISDADLLMEPETCGDLGAEVAHLVRHAAHRQAENARTLQQAEDRAQTAAENAEVAKMREKAVVDLVASVASSATSLTGSAINLGAQMKSLTTDLKAAAAHKDITKDAGCLIADKRAKVTQLATEIAKDGVKIGADALHFAANQLEADGKAAGAEAHHRERLSQAAKDEADAARKLAQDAVEFQKEWHETVNETLLALSRRA